MDVALLLTPAAQRLLDSLGAFDSGDAATDAVGRLRKAGHDAELVAAVVTQARLRGRARAKFGEAAEYLLFTDAGLQQATRAEVAALHAARFATAGVHAVADLGCGIGADALAFATAGLRVLAVERDPDTAAIAAHNLAVSAAREGHPAPGGGSSWNAPPDSMIPSRVVVAEAEAVPLDEVDAVWLDPARRTTSKRLSDPADWSPSLDFAFGLGARYPTGVKLGPGIDRGLIPGEAEAQWVSVRGEVVEAVAWFGAVARPGIRRAALVLAEDGAHELTASADAPDVAAGPLGAFLLEPDGAVIRARLIGDLARSLPGGARMIDPTIAWVTADAEPRTPFGQAFRVVAELPLDEKAIRRELAARGIGTLEIKVRGVDVDPAEYRKRVLPGTPSREALAATLILTRLAGRRRAILAERLG